MGVLVHLYVFTGVLDVDEFRSTISHLFFLGLICILFLVSPFSVSFELIKYFFTILIPLLSFLKTKPFIMDY